MELLRQHGIDTTELRSKSWDEFTKPGQPEMHFIFTVCDNAAGETCPLWPGRPMTAHWGVADPAAVQGSDDEKRKAFADAFRLLSNRIRLFINLPFERLEPRILKNKLYEIGKT